MIANMHKQYWSLGLALLVGSARIAPAQRVSAPIPKIFREVTFQPFAPITLGEAFPEHGPRRVAVGPGRAALALQGFGDTDSVYVDSNSDLTVRALEFVYPRKKDIPAAVTEYEQSLGVANQAATDSAGQRLLRWTWRDSNTEFQFSVLKSPQAISRVWSGLRDLLHR